MNGQRIFFLSLPIRHANRLFRLLGLLGLILCATACNRSRGAEPPFRLKGVGSNVWAAVDNPNASTRSGANAGFVIGDDGVAVIDTFANSESAAQLLADIRTLTKLPVRFVINTHHHGDHVAGNGIFVNIE